MRFTKLVQDYPITLTVGVNEILLNFAAAFAQPTFVTFSLLLTGAVLVRHAHDYIGWYSCLAPCALSPLFQQGTLGDGSSLERTCKTDRP